VSLIHQGRDGLNAVKAALAAQTNKAGLTGSTESALRGADVFIGLSSGTVAESAIASMASGAIVFALFNPDPEVHPDVAGRHALVVATGRSDFPNQINNSLAFPAVFRGALDTRASDITDGMKLAAAVARQARHAAPTTPPGALYTRAPAASPPRPQAGSVCHWPRSCVLGGTQSPEGWLWPGRSAP
jgi:malic enzyme